MSDTGIPHEPSIKIAVITPNCKCGDHCKYCYALRFSKDDPHAVTCRYYKDIYYAEG